MAGRRGDFSSGRLRFLYARRVAGERSSGKGRSAQRFCRCDTLHETGCSNREGNGYAESRDC